MKLFVTRLPKVAVLLITAIAITLATAAVGYHVAPTSLVSNADLIPLDVAGFPLYFVVGDFQAVVWGHLLVDVGFWLALIYSTLKIAR